MAAPAPRAIAIALPLWQALRAKPFSGYVAGRFERACNLADDDGRVVALTLPAVGNGPFCVVLAAAGRFNELDPGQPAHVCADQMTIGSWHIPLSGASIWDARLPDRMGIPQLSPASTAILQPYTEWPRPTQSTLFAAYTARALAAGARTLIDALARNAGVAEAARQLAGLGAGLTPAGDDYLLGAMAALWLLGDRAMLPLIAQSAAPRTTALSAAFLTAAARGQFMELWHRLAQALRSQNERACLAAVGQISALGASSGRDALAGFAAVMFNRERSC